MKEAKEEKAVEKNEEKEEIVEDPIIVEEAAEEKSEEESTEEEKKEEFDISEWNPKTSVGKAVQKKEIVDINELLDKGLPILEEEIVDVLVPDLESDLILIGQSKGKFGGGQRRVFKQTQKKTREGNKPHFGALAVVGNKNGIVGIGYGKAKETVPAREKAKRNAKLNIIKIRRGCGSWACSCKEHHSIPFEVVGKVGSSEIRLMPAPKGTGLVIEKECGKILEFAGIKDVWSKTKGQTTKSNLAYACFEALKKLMTTKLQPKHYDKLNVVEGKAQNGAKAEEK
ncbi:30S ribosomal protein S5 [Candidatus Woesearchaeota archaeon]|nr:MAG: 30S ribosomal protein S5 [Candidatus Woesearchaeota archaeon]